MTIWYEMTELLTWSRPHLTGIQRSTVGILNGLVELGTIPRLTAFDSRRGAFVPIDAGALPDVVRAGLPWFAGASGRPRAGDLPAVVTRRRRRALVRQTIFGTSAEAEELRAAFRQSKAFRRQVRKVFGRWLRQRSRELLGLRRWSALPHPTESPAARPGPAAESPLAPGDILLTIGASWVYPEQAAITARERSRGVRVVQFIHDLIPTFEPQWVDDPDAAVRYSECFTRWVDRVIAGSDHLLTNSQFSRGDIERRSREAGLTTAPISVVRLGDVHDTASIAAPPRPPLVPPRPFFLCTSSLNPHKNHRLLYEVWKLLAAENPETCPDLVCVGMASGYVRDLLREIRNDRTTSGRIHLLSDVGDAELAWYFRHCVATIYPSKYEGWGLPVAESLGNGRLCLASNAASIPEISPDLPVFFDPLDVHGLLALVRRTRDDPAWVRDREAEIRRRFVPTPWTHTAGQVLAALAAMQAGTENCPSDARAA